MLLAFDVAILSQPTLAKQVEHVEGQHSSQHSVALLEKLSERRGLPQLPQLLPPSDEPADDVDTSGMAVIDPEPDDGEAEPDDGKAEADDGEAEAEADDGEAEEEQARGLINTRIVE